MNTSEKPVVLELKHITKSFGDTEVLNGIDLTIHEGEFVTLLGSSGCGKTTTLRIIAGLEYPDSGEVLLEGQPMKDQPPEKRSVNTVFQNYALFPHMNVYNNIAYGLKLRKTGKDEIKKRVTEMLSLVQLEGFEKRMPSEMSGGQRQRVAIARALINNPRVLLLDEPLGALDLQLRRQMQHELKLLQKKLGITFIYITHDQEEAINMSDVIVVMKDGRFEQIGSPAEIYDHPKTSYVASFVGSANILQGTVISVSAEQAVLRSSSGTMPCKAEHFHVKEGETRTLAIRSESISIWREPRSDFWISGTITEKSYAGGMLRIVVSSDEGPGIVITRQGINFDYDIGEHVYLEWPAAQAVFVDMEAQA
ncbi:MAG: ABC transporter ATP-binding protein [Lachnospiraceae bacterium]|nr:ABC transporter ATP-binding protein [Lachnospiraceae bacterium]